MGLSRQVGRRSPGSCCAAISATLNPRKDSLTAIQPEEATPDSPSDGGCIFAEDSAKSFAEARPIWSATTDPSVIRATANPPHHADGVDLCTLGERRWIATDNDGREHLAIVQGGRHLRIDVISGTIRQGPVLLEFHLDGVSDLRWKLDALHLLLRLCGLTDPGWRGLFPDRRLPRLAEALRVLDALEDGASMTMIAAALLEHRQDALEWPGDGDSIKSWVRRRISLARALREAGPRGVLANLI